MLTLLGRLATRHCRLVLATSVLVAIAAVVLAAGAFKVLRDGISPNPHSESTKQAEAFAHAFPEQQYSLFVLFSSPSMKVQDPAFQAAAQPVIDTLKRDPAVATMFNYFDTPVPQLLSKDGHETLVPVVLRGDGPGMGAAYLRLEQVLKSDKLQVRLGGVAAISKEINVQIKSDIARSEKFSFAILAVLLLFIFRSVVATILPLIVGGLSIALALALTRIIGTFVDVTVYAANIITFLGLGLAIDYSLFILSRYREELAIQPSTEAAVMETMRTAGRTVAFSGSIVALSLLGLLVFPRNFLYSMAIGGSIAVFASVATSLTVLPAFLTWLGPRIEKGRIGRRRRPMPQDTSSPQNSDTEASVLRLTPGANQGFWTEMSHFVMRRAGIVVTLVLAILFLVGAPFLNVKFSTVDAHTLPPSFESRQVFDEMATNFNLGASSPIQVLLESNGAPNEGQNEKPFADYIHRIETLPGVLKVHSELNRDPLQELPRVKGNTATIDIDYAGTSQSSEAQKLVAAVRALPEPPGSKSYVGGATANLVDLLADLQSHAWQAGAVIGISTFVLLLFMLNSILVPIKAIVFNALSLSAAFGALVWVFQYGHLEGLIGFTSNGAIDANEPILIFVIAFGLAVDYEVFLVSRMKEAHERGLETTDAVAFGLEKTGQIITSAALLLMVVIGAFTTGKLGVMKQLGFGLGLAVFIDATLVRSLLVPATMKFLGKYNWWTPKFLSRVIEKANVGH